MSFGRRLTKSSLRSFFVLGFFPKMFREDEAINWDLVMPPKDQIYDIVDIGANLGHKRFARDWQQVVDQATVAGVKQIILTGTSVRDSIRVLDLARQKPGVLYCTGMLRLTLFLCIFELLIAFFTSNEA